MASHAQSFTGKVALITGGSKGIGKATAQLLASHGAHVVINYNADSSSANETIESFPDPSKALAVQADAGSMEGIDKMVNATVEAFGKIDILIPNAGLLLMRDTENTTEADFDASYRLNVKAPYFLVQRALPHMSSGSHVIHLSTSVCAWSSVPPPYLLYTSTKGAVEQMTRIQGKDLGRKGIFVNALAPGPTATELFFKGKTEQMINGIKSSNPFNRLGEPQEIADAILFLASSTWVNGQVLRVNGGMA